MSPLFDLSGRTALVTGAGQGMGVGIVQALARQGANVLVNDLHEERAEAVAAQVREAGLSAIAAPGDITCDEMPGTLVALAQDRFGKLDILVNNAGVVEGMSTALRPLDSLERNDFDRQLALNFHAVVNLSRAVLPGMRERGHGRIVTITSESWRLGQRMGLSDYASAKAAGVGFCRTLAAEEGRNGVTVNLISLGAMNNYGYDDIAAKITAVGRAGTPDDVGAAVVYFASDEASWATGQMLPLNGGSTTA